MATGHSNQLTRQIGEHLVAAELGRLGYVATPFSGNVPMFDLLAANIEGHAIPIQVKAINGPSWQFKASTFLKIEFQDGAQLITGTTDLPYPELLCIFVLLKKAGEDDFYIFPLKFLQDYFAKNYAPDGKITRPKNATALHCAIWPKDLANFKDNWGLVKARLGAS